MPGLSLFMQGWKKLLGQMPRFCLSMPGSLSAMSALIGLEESFVHMNRALGVFCVEPVPGEVEHFGTVWRCNGMEVDHLY